MKTSIYSRVAQEVRRVRHLFCQTVLLAFPASLAFAGVNITLTPIVPNPSPPPAQPSFSIHLSGDQYTDANGNTERDVTYQYSVSAPGIGTNWEYVYTEEGIWNWADSRGALSSGSYTYTITAEGYHKEAYNYGWEDGHDEEEHDNPDDPNEVTGSHWVDGRWNAGFWWDWQSPLGVANLTFNVAAAIGQTIAFPNPGDRIYGDIFNPGATASSGLAVTYTIVSGLASASGSSVTITGVGPVVIQANQVGGVNSSNGNFYAAAVPTQQSITTSRVNQTITFPVQSPRAYGSYPLSSLGIAMSPNGLPPTVAVVSGPAMIVGNTLTITGGGGTVTLTASQAGDAFRNPATPVNQSFGVTKGTQVISPPVTPGHSTSDAPFSAAASVSSGMALAYSVVSGPATINPTTGSLTLSGAPGIVVVRASQTGDGNWTAATDITYSYTVTAPANWVAMTVSPPPSVNISTSAIPLPVITFSTNRLPIGTIKAYLQTPSGTNIGGPVDAVPQSPTTPVTHQGGGSGTNGLVGTYYNDTSFGSAGFTTTDWWVNNWWGQDGPGVGSPEEGGGYDEDEHDNPDNPDEVTGSHWVDSYTHWDLFSVRWTGYIKAPTTDNYTFITTTDDGVRLWINGNLVVNNWSDQGMSDHYSASVSFVQNQSYSVTMEYYENYGDAGAQLWWSSSSRGREIVPHEFLYTSQPIASMNSSYNWTVSGLTIPAGQSAGTGYRIYLSYTPYDSQTVASAGVGTFDILAEPPPTITPLSGDQQSGLVSQFNSSPFDVAIWNTAATAPLVNTPVTFTVRAGGGLLALSNLAGAAQQSSLTLQTDVDGTALAYYRQPATAGITSEITVSSGGAQKVFLTLSATSVDPNKPDSLQSSAGAGGSIALLWTASTPVSGGPTIAGYNVYRNGARINASPIAATSYNDNAVVSGNSYAYSVRAIDQQGNLSPAASALATAGGLLSVQLRLPPDNSPATVSTGTWMR